MDVPQQTLVDRVARCLGQRLVDCQSVAGGYSPALRLIVRCADGMSVFVKGATDAAQRHGCAQSMVSSDLVFDLSNPTINVYPNDILLVALGWKSYDTYLAEMTSLLS
jgi:hypothetical protein